MYVHKRVRFDWREPRHIVNFAEHSTKTCSNEIDDCISKVCIDSVNVHLRSFELRLTSCAHEFSLFVHNWVRSVASFELDAIDHELCQ